MSLFNFPFSITEISNWIQSLISSLIILFLAALTLLEVLDRFGVNLPWYSKGIRIRESKRINDIIFRLYTKEHSFLLDQEEERINSLLVQLGLKSDQFIKVKSEIRMLQRLEMTSLKEKQDKLRKVSTSTLVLVDSTHFPDKIYGKVLYKFNRYNVSKTA